MLRRFVLSGVLRVHSRCCAQDALASSSKESHNHAVVAAAVQKKLKVKGVDLLLPPTPSSEDSAIEYLSSLGLAQYRIRDMCCINPDLLQISPAQVRGIFDVLEGAGLLLTQRIEVVSTYPELLHDTTPEQMNDTLSSLRSVQVRGKVMVRIIRTCPQVFTEPDPERFRILINNLHSFFSNSQVLHLLYHHSPIIFSRFEDLEEKYEYVYFKMGVQQGEIKKSQTWYKRTLDFIRMRHECCARSGVFMQPHHKKPTIALNNPKLPMVLDTPRSYFARMVAGISLEEYDAFKAMFMRQMHQRDMDDDEDMEVEKREEDSEFDDD